MLHLLSRFCTPSTSRSALFDAVSAIQIRTATKRGGGSTKNNRSSAGRRLGVKRFGDQYVKAGEILVRQRGTSWYPGQHVSLPSFCYRKVWLITLEQVGVGKDHTLWALEPGYVKFYKQTKAGATGVASPEETSPGGTAERILRKERRYIGVALSLDEKLPRDLASMGRSRRLGVSLL